MATRQYSSFLLRFWLIDNPTPDPDSMVLQVQHLQTGATWRVNSLTELNSLLRVALADAADPEAKLLSNRIEAEQ